MVSGKPGAVHSDRPEKILPVGLILVSKWGSADAYDDLEVVHALALDAKHAVPVRGVTCGRVHMSNCFMHRGDIRMGAGDHGY